MIASCKGPIVTANDESGKILAFVEAVIFYRAEPESGNTKSKFVGSKERVRIDHFTVEAKLPGLRMEASLPVTLF